MGNASKKDRRSKVVAVLNQARAMELQAIHQYMNQHYNYFDNVNDHIEKLGNIFLAKNAGTPSSTGLGPSGFAVGGEGN